MAHPKTSIPKKYSALTWGAVGVALLAFIAYLPALQNGFVEWDDNRYVYENLMLGKWNRAAWAYYWGEYVMGNWHPLTMMSLSLDKTLFGAEPWGFHFTNMIFHAFNSAGVVWIGFRLFPGTLTGIWAGALFAVHPLHVESVAWAAERKDVLYTFFVLGSLISWSYRKKGDYNKYYYISLLLFFLACTAKAQAVVTPVLAWLMDTWNTPARRFQMKALLAYVPGLIISVIIGIVAIDAQAEGGNIRVFHQYSIIDQFLIGAYGLFFYLYKTILPIAQSAYYPYPIKSEAGLPFYYWLAPLVIAAIAGVIVYFGKKLPVLLLGMGCFIIAILPVLQWLPVGETMVSERYYYLPSIGLCILIGYGFQYLTHHKYIYYVGTILICGLLLLTQQRTRKWADTYVLFLDVLDQFPNVPVAYNNIANQFTADKDYRRAIAFYHTALKYRPDYPIGHHNLGNNYTHIDSLNKALFHFHKFLSLKPGDTLVLHKLGTVWSKIGNQLASSGNLDSAAICFRKALVFNNALPECYGNLGNIYAIKKEYDAADKMFQEALRLNPGNESTLFNYGLMLYQYGQLENAVEKIRQAAAKGNPSAAQWLQQMGVSQ
jgi:Tfp pilus assembly protein PilF